MRRAKSAKNDCFVLTYESLHDPARDEVAEVLHGLEPVAGEGGAARHDPGSG